MRFRLFLWSCLTILTLLMANINIPIWLLPIKYISLAFLIFITTNVILSFLHTPRLHNKKIAAFLQACSFVLLLFYVILTIDTFIFHAWTWFPGLLRYPIYDAYGLCYIVFILPAVLWYIGGKESTYA